jgi:hypothetical protein
VIANDDTDYGGFAAALNSRLEADARVATAVGFAWLCGGIAILVALTGLGLACALYGYGHLISAKPAADKIADALTRALEVAELKTSVSGKMALVPTPLKLALGQTIKLEEGATVRLDPNSSVRAVGNLNIDMPQPSKRQLQVDTTTGNQELPFTSYTIFKDVEFGSGTVATGWDFDLADTTRPRSQFCYYTQDITKGLRTKYTLATNGSPQRPSPLQKLPFDYDQALSNCIWFSGF